MNSVSTIDISFRYSEADYIRAMRAHYASRLRLPLDIAVIVLTAAMGAHFWRLPSTHWFGVSLVCMSIVFGLMLITIFFVIPLVSFRREPKFGDEYALTFSPEGIHFRTVHIDSQLQWNIYTRALIASHSYVLYYGAYSFTVIPKRVFQTDAQREAFEELIVRNLPKVTRKRT
jgi:hypothetical protein